MNTLFSPEFAILFSLFVLLLWPAISGLRATPRDYPPSVLYGLAALLDLIVMIILILKK